MVFDAVSIFHAFPKNKQTHNCFWWELYWIVKIDGHNKSFLVSFLLLYLKRYNMAYYWHLINYFVFIGTLLSVVIFLESKHQLDVGKSQIYSIFFFTFVHYKNEIKCNIKVLWSTHTPQTTYIQQNDVSIDFSFLFTGFWDLF